MPPTTRKKNAVTVPKTVPVPEETVAPVSAPTPVEPATNEHWLPSKYYDFIKLLAQIILPAVATLYFAVGGIYGLGGAEKVIGTITAVDAFLGVFLSISKAQYLASDSPYDGTVNVVPNADGTGKVFDMTLNGDPQNLDQQSSIRFKMNSQ